MDETDQESTISSLISKKMTKEEEAEQQKDTSQGFKERQGETTQNQNGGDGDEEIKERKNEKQCHPGIIYLGHIPPMLRPKHLRNMLSAYGEIGRIFMQPEDRQVRRRKKKSGSRRSRFVEGWVEFRDKRIAKRVAASLHNTPMGTKRRQMFFADLWNMKYLHRFQWTHLNERLVYEQTVLQQRLRAEVSQAKRETNFYLNNVEKSAHLDKARKKRQRDGEQVDEKRWEFTQRPTEEEFQKRKKTKAIAQKHLDKARLLQEKSQSNASLLVKIFNSNPSE